MTAESGATVVTVSQRAVTLREALRAVIIRGFSYAQRGGREASGLGQHNAARHDRDPCALGTDHDGEQLRVPCVTCDDPEPLSPSNTAPR